jgi:hypothetical protein
VWLTKKSKLYKKFIQKYSLILHNKNIFMYTAKELDNETSYTYFGARYYDIKLGETGGFLDIYDFDIKKGVEHIPRNIATWIGKQIAGKGTSYNIFYYGIGKVK